MREEPPITLHQVPFSGLVYPGEVILAPQWEARWGARLSGEALFRIVLLRQGQRLSKEQLSDVRIAVCVPGRSRARQQAEALRELRAVAEARAVYSAVPGPDAGTLREALRRQEAELQQRLAQQDASSYVSGEITTLGNLRLTAQEAFQSGEMSQGLQGIAVALLAWAYPTLPIDPSSFPHPLTADDIPPLYRTLVMGQASPAERELTGSFAPGLRLAAPDLPAALDPRGCPVLDAIGEALETRGGAVHADALLQLLCHSRGLPQWLALLYLLAFVRSRPDSVQLSLREGHGLRLDDGTPLVGGALNGFIIRDLPWQDNLLAALQEVRLSQEPSWVMAIPLATPLQRHVEPDAALTGEDSFPHTLVRLREGLGQAKQVLDALAQAAVQPSSGETSESLRRLTEVSEGARWQEFYRACLMLYEGPLALASDLRRYGTLQELLPNLSDIRSAVRYLREMPLGSGQGELALEREALLAQLQPSALTSGSGLWASVRQQFLRLAARYRSAYVAHHSTYQGTVSALATGLERLSSQVEALEAFNTLSELGAPVRSDLPTRFRQFQESLRQCPVSQEALPLDSQPVCPVCGLGLDERAPQAEAERLMAELTGALRQQNRRLGSRAVQRILRSDAALLDKLIRVVQVSDLDSLGTVMDDAVIQFLRAFLTTP